LPVKNACAAVTYDSISRRFVLHGKQHGRPELLRFLGRQLAAACTGEFLEGCDAVVPVPSHPMARLRRGFDPAEEIALGLCRARKLPMRSRFLRRRWLRPNPIKGLGADARRRAARERFRAGRLVGSPVLVLVDDVVTTGATARAAASALLASGAREVRLAAWARTHRRQPVGDFDRFPPPPYNAGFSDPRLGKGRTG
jgi:predicted amidophosphoribosyltransferase